MFIRIFTLTSLLLILLSSCNNGAKAETKPNQKSEKKAEQDQSSEQEFVFQQIDDDQVAAAFLANYGKRNREQRIQIVTDFGPIEIKLYRNTPLHRANMIYLIKEHQYFNDTWFHRVSPEHVIQAGNNDEFELQKKRGEIGNYKIASEFKKGNYHKYGAVAMARPYKRNLEKKSDPFEFYITLGATFSDAQLDALEEQYGISLNQEQRKIYREQGGSPHLDMEHTVFGEVVKGMEVVEQIAKVETDRGEWPLDNIPIQVQIKKD